MISLLALGNNAEDTGSLIIKTKEGADFAIQSPLRPEITDVSSLVDVLLPFFLSFAAIVLLLMLIYGGFVFMTAQGNEESIKKGQRVIISAIVGMVLLVIAFFLTRVLGYIFGLEGGGVVPQDVPQ